MRKRSRSIPRLHAVNQSIFRLECFVLAAACIAVMALATSCTDDPTPVAPTSSPEFDSAISAAGSDDTEVTVSQIYEDIHAFVGRPVSMTGEVVEILTDNAFTFRGATSPDSRVILVITAGLTTDPDLAPGDFIWVRSVVRDFDVKELETGDINLADERLEPFNDEPVLFAERLMSEVFTIDVIVSAAEAFSGRTVTVIAPVTQVLGSQALIVEGEDWFLGFGADSLPVVYPPGTVSGAVKESTVVAINGTIRMLRADENGDLRENFPFLFEDAEFEPYDGQPILIADSLVVTDQTQHSG